MSLDSIHPLLPHGSGLWKANVYANSPFQQRSEYAYKKATIAVAPKERLKTDHDHASQRDRSKPPNIYAALLPLFDEMAPLYPPDMRSAAERHLRNRMMVFAADVGLRVLGLPLSQPLDHATLVRLASYLLDTDVEQKLKTV